jgi:hypothetical protein
VQFFHELTAAGPQCRQGLTACRLLHLQVPLQVRDSLGLADRVILSNSSIEFLGIRRRRCLNGGFLPTFVTCLH